MTLMRKHWFYLFIVMSYIAAFLWLSGFQNSPVKAAHQTLIGATWIGTLVLACWVCYRPPHAHAWPCAQPCPWRFWLMDSAPYTALLR